MRAIIKSFQSIDIEDLYNFTPLNRDNFSFLLELMVGPDTEEGEESFNIQVCTPQWLSSNMKKEDILLGNYFLIVLEYNFERIFNKIRQLVEGCSGNNWNEIAEKVSRIGHWEFENYVE
jgi:hypothetical protein